MEITITKFNYEDKTHKDVKYFEVKTEDGVTFKLEYEHGALYIHKSSLSLGGSLQITPQVSNVISIK